MSVRQEVLGPGAVSAEHRPLARDTGVSLDTLGHACLLTPAALRPTPDSPAQEGIHGGQG